MNVLSRHRRSSTMPEPVSGFRFAVEIKGIIEGWFTECSGLSIEREVYTHQEGGANDFEHKLPGRIKYTNITLKRGVADDKLWDWFQKGLYDGQVKRTNISIILYNSDLSPAKRWNLIAAFPVKWTGPDFNAGDNQVAIETIEIAHHGLEIIN